MRPRYFIIFHPVAFVEGGVVGNFFTMVKLAFGDGVFVGLAGFQFFDGFPNETINAYAGEAF